MVRIIKIGVKIVFGIFMLAATLLIVLLTFNYYKDQGTPADSKQTLLYFDNQNGKIVPKLRKTPREMLETFRTNLGV